ncbi:class E sortase [Nocardioides panacisoli]|uniref:class E sortase n=1 Tax=Nocardioides panacisoli TaxID=627624 RepID=UPI001C6329FB|nr:class E sortase [Nocardioides panacisoli]QYJ04382.1 class E sortase [Nocardioides panacisoli]
MTELSAPESTVGSSRRRRRRGRGHGRRHRPRDLRSRSLLTAGLALILAGLVVLGWVAWQFWGTNWQSQQRHGDVADSLRDGWTTGEPVARTDWGEATALLRVPHFGADFMVPVLEGATDEVLAAGVGHMGDTAPGERGNYVLAGHRVTHGEPFADLLGLEPGDIVQVETRDEILTYELDTPGDGLRLPFTAGWVLDPSPTNPDGGVEPPAAAGDHLLTLLTCSEIFHTDDRSIVFGHLVDRRDKTG